MLLPRSCAYACRSLHAMSGETPYCKTVGVSAPQRIHLLTSLWCGNSQSEVKGSPFPTFFGTPKSVRVREVVLGSGWKLVRLRSSSKETMCVASHVGIHYVMTGKRGRPGTPRSPARVCLCVRTMHAIYDKSAPIYFWDSPYFDCSIGAVCLLPKSRPCDK